MDYPHSIVPHCIITDCWLTNWQVRGTDWATDGGTEYVQCSSSFRSTNSWKIGFWRHTGDSPYTVDTCILGVVNSHFENFKVTFRSSFVSPLLCYCSHTKYLLQIAVDRTEGLCMTLLMKHLHYKQLFEINFNCVHYIILYYIILYTLL